MLSEFFQALIEHAGKATRPTLLHPEAEPEHRYAIAHPGGEVVWMQADPMPRAHQARDLTAIVDLAKQWAGPSEDDPEGSSGSLPVIWFSRAAVVLLLDDATRRDRVQLNLDLHPQLKTMAQLEASKPLHDQKGFVSLLRIQLVGCLRCNLLEVVRKVKFRQLQEGASVVQHGKASMGRQLEAELTGAGIIPEQIVLDVPVFAGPLSARRYAVECALEVDPATEKFQLIPFPGQIEQAICDAEADIGIELVQRLGSAVPVYYGQP